MVSSKAAEWVAEFVADVVRLNPAVLPSPGSTTGGGPAVGPAFSPSRSPRPSPRPSMRSSMTNILQATGSAADGDSSTSGPSLTEQQQQLSEVVNRSSHSSHKESACVINYGAAGLATQNTDNGAHSCPVTLPPWAASGIAMQVVPANGAIERSAADCQQPAVADPLAAGLVSSSGGSYSSSSCSTDTTSTGSASEIRRNFGSNLAGKALLAKRWALMQRLKAMSSILTAMLVS